MGNGRRFQKQVNNVSKKNNFVEVLADLLASFYEYLESDTQPTNEEVRERFLKDKNSWFLYCNKHNLNDQTKDLFVLNVDKMWKHNQVD